MADISIRNLDPAVKDRLRIMAAQRGRSMEAEIRAILAAAGSETRPESLPKALMNRFAEVGGVELELPARSTPPRAAEVVADRL